MILFIICQSSYSYTEPLKHYSAPVSQPVSILFVINRTMNATNIAQILEDLWYLVQSNIDEWAFQIQRMLANKLDQYKERGNKYIDDNIREIQELYIDEEMKKEEEKVEDKEVILIKPYEVSITMSSSSKTSFITDKVENLLKYMKFVWSPTQTRLFKPLPYYQFLKSRGEQDPVFWKEVAMALVDQKHNTNIARNGYQIPMFQEGPPYGPYFIAINNREQVIIGPSKKIVATHVIGELEVLIWFMRTWMLKWGYCYNWCLQDAVWRRAKGMTIQLAVL